MTNPERSRILASRGATDSHEWFRWPTATAVLDPARSVLLIATDPEPAPDDWDAVCTLLELSGYCNGTDGPFTTDPGEPDWDRQTGVCTWNLPLPALAWS
jgi:hypothetical protein